MKELTQKAPVEINKEAEQQKKLVNFAKINRNPGHQIWKYDAAKDDAFVIQPEGTANMDGGGASLVNATKGELYVSALNKKNALRKFRKFL